MHPPQPLTQQAHLISTNSGPRYTITYVCKRLRVKLLHQERDKDQTKPEPPSPLFPFFPFQERDVTRQTPAQEGRTQYQGKWLIPARRNQAWVAKRQPTLLPSVGSQRLAWIQEKKEGKNERSPQPTDPPPKKQNNHRPPHHNTSSPAQPQPRWLVLAVAACTEDNDDGRPSLSLSSLSSESSSLAGRLSSCSCPSRDACRRLVICGGGRDGVSQGCHARWG